MTQDPGPRTPDPGLRPHHLRGRFFHLLERCSCRQIHRWQVHADQQMIVGRRAAIAHLATSRALVDDHLFAVAAKGHADRFHQTAAFILAVARCAIDMFRIETERTMVPVPPATDRRSDERFAMTALEFFGFGLAAGWRPVGPLLPVS